MQTTLRAALTAHRLDGAALLPGDSGFDEHRACWNLTHEHRPAAIVSATSTADVQAAIRCAAERGLRIAVQSTGHGPTRAADDEALLLNLAGLGRVSVDAGEQVAVVGGGVTWSPVLAAAQQHGLAPLLGSAPHVGAVGYTLGGGFGWLARRHGLALDRVRRLAVVLADGRLVQASPTDHPDLFWAMLGAGAGSLGVVVEMEIGLVPVRDVYAGNLLYPASDAADVFDFYLDWIQTVGGEVTSAFNITAFPPLEVVPAPLRGRAFAILRGCHCGDLGEAQALIDLWRRWRKPEVDMFGLLPFSASASISQDPVDPVPASASGRWMRRANADTVVAMVEAVLGGQGPSPVLFAELRHAGGAVGRANPAASFAARAASFSLEAVALTPTPQAHEEAGRRHARLWARVADEVAPLGAYLNFLEGQERVELTRSAFDPETLTRLAAVKKEVDPDGTFSYGLPL